jgi:hypothetical protein
LQYSQELQFLHALQGSLPLHFAVIPSPLQQFAGSVAASTTIDETPAIPIAVTTPRMMFAARIPGS